MDEPRFDFGRADHRMIALIGSLCLAFAVNCTTALAQVANFNVRQVRLIIGYDVGGGNDQYARLIGRYLTKYLPGHPQVIPQNIPGAGSLTAAETVYNLSPKDGSVIGLISSAVPAQLLISGSPDTKFNAAKVTWIGSPSYAGAVCGATDKAKVDSLEDLMKTELVVGALGAGSTTQILPIALNGFVGTKLKVVSGYPGAADIFLAMDRGEVQGMCTTYSSFKIERSAQMANGQIKILFEAASKHNPEIKAPFLLDLIQDKERRQALEFIFSNGTIGRPFIAPPDLPPAITTMLRAAFDATMKDPEFLAEADKQKFDIAPVSGAELEKIVGDLYTTPKSTLQEVKKVLGDQAVQ
jgi:tripartite-type tricarboxylate transporter receptor subunit TctC